MKKNMEKGITLVALVVTIIVLMILAGITLSLVLGQNGIISKAQQAKALSINADIATQEGLNSLENELELSTNGEAVKISDVSTIKDAISKAAVAVTDNKSLKDDSGNAVIIPAGFKVASDSATKQEDGIVIEDKDGNQYVWIPVASVANYARTDFGSAFDFGGGYSNYSETIPSDEQASVNTYHGYYIGRYEAGDKEATANKVIRSSRVVTDTLTIKKGQAPYNYVARDDSQTLAEGMDTAEGYKAITRLCSSYAWDTAINFIQNKVANYAISSNQGNYNNTTFNYTDITGVGQTKPLNSNLLVTTGETTPVCNIYDMGGNEWEWTSETCNDASHPYVPRGGVYYDTYAGSSAGSRGYGSGTGSSGSVEYVGFRVALFM